LSKITQYSEQKRIIMFKREIYYILFNRLQEKRRFIQVIAGPRQVGKTTLVQQVMTDLSAATLYASADEPSLRGPTWIEQQWQLARQELKQGTETVLILDEIQKLPHWSSTVKQLWDEDTRNKIPLKVVLLGSAPLLLQHGLTESLAGRFEKIVATHWSYQEMHKAFNWTLSQYIYFGGYPGAASLIDDQNRWRYYINDALIETTLSRDILQLNPIHKPALLRRLFEFACHYSAQILSYQKMTGQLQEAGNTTTLAHYLELLTAAGMVTGISKYAGQIVRQRASSPKLQVLNTALLSAQSSHSFEDAEKDYSFWGRLVESSVGAYLLNNAIIHGMKVYYWRENNKEVDFIVEWRKKIIAIEVKSGLAKEAQPGITAFCEQYKTLLSLVIGGQNCSLEKFLSTPVIEWF
jgi:predicted AAA+ superfamily ATPase